MKHLPRYSQNTQNPFWINIYSVQLLTTSCPTLCSVLIIPGNVFYGVTNKNPQLLTHTAPELHHPRFRLFWVQWIMGFRASVVTSQLVLYEKKVHFKAMCRIWPEAESHFLHRCCLGRGFRKQKCVGQRDHTQTKCATYTESPNGYEVNIRRRRWISKHKLELYFFITILQKE